MRALCRTAAPDPKLPFEGREPKVSEGWVTTFILRHHPPATFLFDAANLRMAGLILGSNPRTTMVFWTRGVIPLNAPYQFMSNGGYSRNTLAAVIKMCCVTVRGASVSPASRRKASGSTS